MFYKLSMNICMTFVATFSKYENAWEIFFKFSAKFSLLYICKCTYILCIHTQLNAKYSSNYITIISKMYCSKFQIEMHYYYCYVGEACSIEFVFYTFFKK